MDSSAGAIPAWVDGSLRPMDKIEVHRRGLRHPAVSVFVLSPRGILMQQRAAGKYHSGGLWANTCCTHPHWGEDPDACARRRLDQELGITGVDPVRVERIEYRADVGNGMTEHEVVDLYLAQAPGDLAVTPDPAEVMAVRWMTLAELRADIDARPADYTAWLRIYLAEHAESLGLDANIRP